MSSYEQTYLSTKIDTIQAVNEWIGDGNQQVSYINCVRQVATLCLAEVCHSMLDGLLELD